jgi:hypothetical protein
LGLTFALGSINNINMSRASIKNIHDLVERLGGVPVTAQVLQTEPHQVRNWRKLGHIPAHFYFVHRKRLDPFDLKIKDDVWGFLR